MVIAAKASDEIMQQYGGEQRSGASFTRGHNFFIIFVGILSLYWNN